jgi:hypothetical protein
MSDTVAHTCNLSYSGGRGRRIASSRPKQAKKWQDPISKTKTKKKGEEFG